MLIGIARPLIIAAAGLWLAGCTTSSSFSNLFVAKIPGADASASAPVDLADRAYSQAVGILGPTVEILNNQGYSYMLRCDYRRAHATLAAARHKDPNNKYVQNNLRLLDDRKGKFVE